jgi:hypothetical protein
MTRWQIGVWDNDLIICFPRTHKTSRGRNKRRHGFDPNLSGFIPMHLASKQAAQASATPKRLLCDCYMSTSLQQSAPTFDQNTPARLPLVVCSQRLSILLHRFLSTSKAARSPSAVPEKQAATCSPYWIDPGESSYSLGLRTTALDFPAA